MSDHRLTALGSVIAAMAAFSLSAAAIAQDADDEDTDAATLSEEEIEAWRALTEQAAATAVPADARCPAGQVFSVSRQQCVRGITSTRRPTLPALPGAVTSSDADVLAGDTRRPTLPALPGEVPAFTTTPVTSQQPSSSIFGTPVGPGVTQPAPVTTPAPVLAPTPVTTPVTTLTPTPRATQACASDRASQVPLDLELTFTFDSAELTPTTKANLTTFANYLRTQGQDLAIRIEGHTDAHGDAAYNDILARQRAENARDFLVQQGVSGQRVAMAGCGERAPRVADGLDPSNRRVEAIIAN